MQLIFSYFVHFRPVTDYNEVTLHFIQCVRMHLENTKSQVCCCDVQLFYTNTLVIAISCSLVRRFMSLNKKRTNAYLQHCRLVALQKHILPWDPHLPMASVK